MWDKKRSVTAVQLSYSLHQAKKLNACDQPLALCIENEIQLVSPMPSGKLTRREADRSKLGCNVVKVRLDNLDPKREDC